MGMFLEDRKECFIFANVNSIEESIELIDKIPDTNTEDDMIEIAIAALKACDETVDETNEEEKEQNDNI